LTPDGHPPEVLNDYAKRVAPLLAAAFPAHAEAAAVDLDESVLG